MTQTEQILDYLKQGNSLTPIEALNLMGCFRLGARIYDLKAMGHDIRTKMISNGEKTFAMYYMEKSNITEKRGQYAWTL